MSMDIASALRAYAQAPKPAQSGEEAQGSGFAELISETMGDAVRATRAGEQAMTAGAAGQAELVDVVTAVANAETTLETMISLRDRVITAYQEIMRMPI